MKIIENDWNQSKEVVYKGSTLIVPIWTNWVAVDGDSCINAFENKPTNDEYEWYESGYFNGQIKDIGKAEFEENEDWKQSLEYVGE